MDQWNVIKDMPKLPFIEGQWVEVLADIRCNATGEVRTYRTEEILDEGDEAPSDFNWSENNYQCDCNRVKFFCRAGKEPEPETNVCTEGKYSVRLRNPVTGNVYYSEFE